MALFYSNRSAKKSAKTTTLLNLTIQDLDYQGLGVAKVNGKTWFVENALPQEVVEATILEEKRQYGKAKTVQFKQKSLDRQKPSCKLFEQCGGCQLQHIPIQLQRETKQKALFQRLQRLQTAPISFCPMIISEPQGYRRRAKLHLYWDKNTLYFGFRQAHSSKIITISACEVLEPELSSLLPKLQQLFSHWQNKKQLGHLELVRADNTICLLLRHIAPLAPQDSDKLKSFAQQHKLSLFVMTEHDQIEHWLGERPYYQIDSLKLYFSIRDFIQINANLNNQMVSTALDWLDLHSTDHVLDLFCGMGNFTLPIAQKVRKVVGIEGVEAMVEQAKFNAEFNQINNATFFQANLDQSFIDKPWAKDAFNKVLLDPARQGALFALDHLCQLQPERIVYVSCNPATLVRDTEKLITEGYHISRCAMIDMFPHTAHLESITLFERVEQANKRSI
ncbi:23S rRNA methyltransferase [Vespertiliibacter pulmonis]|uniref:23S rRNA (uracil(1939)-C(5))-methyltransferase RlmD n=1 Tax=Vespertiliibacter pulmonis TaxID=1443036 RepID=A0A3N4VTS8_9PAST|nr:23S rRNA (uracil(1939)-C(5))-methyltransferase RlmD [Vespertiliibacter pulmonis]QLB20449.1 23S rRNA methyltransferase [Vespertiliibacter pulmonis]RPE86438.1 23S rRNA m(5)U-1939 methyltransferase [Vespertiliibacter pulmonis]